DNPEFFTLFLVLTSSRSSSSLGTSRLKSPYTPKITPPITAARLPCSKRFDFTSSHRSSNFSLYKFRRSFRITFSSSVLEENGLDNLGALRFMAYQFRVFPLKISQK